MVEISRKTTLMREKKSSEELPAEDLIVAMTYYEPLRIVEVGHWKPTLCPNFCERCKTSISCEHLKVVQMQFYISNSHQRFPRREIGNRTRHGEGGKYRIRLEQI